MDIAIDQGGCFEDSRPTTHADPTYAVHSSTFYCVANMPGSVPNTSTYALTGVTLPYAVQIADRGWHGALRSNGALARGLNTHAGALVYDHVAGPAASPTRPSPRSSTDGSPLVLPITGFRTGIPPGRHFPMGELILVRHGRPSGAGRANTGLTDVPLTPHGEEQARALRGALKDRSIVRTLVSPAQRARRTAELAGLPVDETDPDLWEWDYGGYEGISTAEIRKDRPGWFLWDDGVIPGDADHPGETVERVGARADAVLARVGPLLADGDVALVAHGHYLRVLTARWLGLERRSVGCSRSPPGPCRRSAPSTTGRSSAPGTSRLPGSHRIRYLLGMSPGVPGRAPSEGLRRTVMATSETPTRGYTATKDQLQTRLARIEGQVRGIDRMVEDDRYCIDILTQISAVQAALDKVALGLLDGHVRHCVAEGAEEGKGDAMSTELMAAVGRLMRRG